MFVPVDPSGLLPFDHTSHLYGHSLMYPIMQIVATVIYPHDEPPAPLPRAVEAMLAQHFSSVTAAKKAIRRREILVAGKVCNTSRYALQRQYVSAVMVSSNWQNMTGHLVTAKSKSSLTPCVHLFLPFCNRIQFSIQPFVLQHTLTVSAPVLQGCTARGALGMDAEGARGQTPRRIPGPCHPAGLQLCLCI